MLTVRIESPRQDDVLHLLQQGDDYGLSLYPAENYHALDVDDLDQPDVTFLVAREDGTALGTVALVDAGDGTAEVKRMFVSDAARGLGVGTRLLDALHDRARAVGIGTVRLETGLPQAAAIALYRKAGYTDIPRFGPYVDDPTSVCMEQQLV
ncbi:GNAT family N-acetyltransferase [Curtobacterium flaccumfaciens]|uniref:GNAT family N-acetyltransferase n=1 Tax=Curtobacterium flaccumfaciens TaxID=2035 RepID=UPI0039950EED